MMVMPDCCEDKAGGKHKHIDADDGGKSGGNGSDEVSSMAAAGSAGGMPRSSCTLHRQSLWATRATTRAAVARVTWGTTTDALAVAVEALGSLRANIFDGESDSFDGEIFQLQQLRGGNCPWGSGRTRLQTVLRQADRAGGG